MMTWQQVFIAGVAIAGVAAVIITALRQGYEYEPRPSPLETYMKYSRQQAARTVPFTMNRTISVPVPPNMTAAEITDLVDKIEGKLDWNDSGPDSTHSKPVETESEDDAEDEDKPSPEARPEPLSIPIQSNDPYLHTSAYLEDLTAWATEQVRDLGWTPKYVCARDTYNCMDGGSTLIDAVVSIPKDCELPDRPVEILQSKLKDSRFRLAGDTMDSKDIYFVVSAYRKSSVESEAAADTTAGSE
jgi:hypothetical protein